MRWSIRWAFTTVSHAQFLTPTPNTLLHQRSSNFTFAPTLGVSEVRNCFMAGTTGPAQGKATALSPSDRAQQRMRESGWSGFRRSVSKSKATGLEPSKEGMTSAASWGEWTLLTTRS